jgi:uncharacterized membrane protein YhaH (DUF805 family)
MSGRVGCDRGLGASSSKTSVNYEPGTTSHLNGGVLAVLIVLYVALIVFVIWCYVRIIRRTGYSGWWILMSLVPIGNLIMLGFFAFKEWPIQRELTYLRQHAAMTGLPGYGTPHPPPPQGDD